MKSLKLITLIFFLLPLINAKAQNNFNNWYFGNQAAVTFNTVPPTALSNNQSYSYCGSASISDNAGALLFYTNGEQIWDRNHQLMPNSGLYGDRAVSQPALIVPVPGSSLLYYIFTLNRLANRATSLYYSIVDMSLNSGNGDVLTPKNILLATNQTEKLVSANATNCGVWVITHQMDNNRFEARLVTNTGIANPVFSDAGSIHLSPQPPFFYTNHLVGTMKVSKNNQKIALATQGGILELLNFNPTNGTVSNPITFPPATEYLRYAVCFSPDNSKLYMCERINLINEYVHIYQYDLSNPNPTVIINSKADLGSADIVNPGDLQIGPDNKIYFARRIKRYLGLIPNPNLLAPACGLINDGLFLGSALSYYSEDGLPNEIRTGGITIQVNLGNDTLLCPGESLTLSAPAGNTYLWSTGATSQTISVSTTGQYWVSVSNGACTSTDTTNVTFALPVVNLGIDTTLCQGQSITLSAGNANSYLWSTGATSQTINATSAGHYWVRASNGSCFSTDTINISFNTPPTVNLGIDTTLCQGQIKTLNAGTAGNYLWSTGETSQTINVITAGQYWVKAGNGNCFTADTINVYYNTPPLVNLGIDTTLCQGQIKTLNAGTAGSYLWSTGATSQTINVTTAGQYWVKAANGNCSNTDTINIAFNLPPVVNLPKDTTLCNSETVLLDATNTNAIYLWQNGSSQAQFLVTQPGTYYVSVNQNGCYASDTIKIAYNYKPLFSLGSDKTVCDQNPILLDPGITNASYLWQDGSTNSTYLVTQSGLYTVTITNQCGFLSDDILIQKGGCQLFVPNSFTPDGNGKNDLFRPLTYGPLSFYEFIVFNRYGETVFQSKDPLKGWDGNYKGKKQNADTYVWKCVYQIDKLMKTTETGTVILIR